MSLYICQAAAGSIKAGPVGAPVSEAQGKSLPHVQWNWQNTEVKGFVGLSKLFNKSRNVPILN